MYRFTFIWIMIISSLIAQGQDIKTIPIQKDVKVEFENIRSTTNGLNIQLSLPDLVFSSQSTKKGDFNQLNVRGLYKSYDEGNPNIPVYSKLIEVPIGANVKINVVKYEQEIISLKDHGIKTKIIPAQPSLSKSDDPQQAEFKYNKEIYELDDYFKNEIAHFEDDGILRHTRMGRIIISPFEYNPKRNILKVFKNIEIEIVFENADYTATRNLKEKYHSTYFDGIEQAVVPLQGDTKALIEGSPVKYVIVADRMFETALDTFVDWKTMKGFKVVEAYTDVIGATTTSIKSYLQNEYNSPADGIAPTFVLFVGDVAQIPTYTGTAGSHPTDLYYCEYTGDKLPEVFYGRFSAESGAELEPQINKTLQQEKYTIPDAAYLDNVVLVAGVDATYAPVWGNGAINYANDHYTNATNGITSYYYLYGDDSGVMASNNSGASADIRSKISAGVSFSNYTAHCNETGWADPSFSNSHIASLTNQDKYPLLIGNCCLSNRFNYSDCFGEQIVRAVDKGAVGYIGGSNNTYWDEDYYWGVGNTSSIILNPTYAGTSLGVYDRFFHLNGETSDDWFVTAGQMLVAGNLAVQESTSGRKIYYWEIYHLMGDPSLVPYVSVPTTLSATHDDAILLGETTFTVYSEKDAYGALSLDGELIQAKNSDGSGEINFTSLDFSDPATLDLVITKQNRQPYITEIDISPPTVPYIVADSVSVIDLTGINDSNIGYSDSISLNINFKNISPDSAAQNIYAKLSTGNPNVVITQDSLWLESLPAGADSLYENAFNLYVDSSVEDQSQLQLNFEVFCENLSGDPFSNTTRYTSKIIAPSLTVKKIIVDDSGGDYDGIFDWNETTVISVVVENSGSDIIQGLTASLIDLKDTVISFTDPTSDLFVLEASDIDTVDFIATSGDYLIQDFLDTLRVEIVSDIYPYYNDTSFHQITMNMDTLVNINKGGTITARSVRFYDSGGPNNYYTNYENYSIIFTPLVAGGWIEAEFISFDVEPGTSGCNYDNLSAYNHTDNSQSLIGTYCNNNIPSKVTSEVNSSLRFSFYSDQNTLYPGWEAIVKTVCGIDLKIVVTDGINVIEDAYVTLGDYDSKVSDSNGTVMYEDVVISDSATLEIVVNSYLHYNKTYFYTITDITDTIIIDPVPGDTYNAQFVVKHHDIPVKDALVTLSGYGEHYTNSFGIAIFTGVDPQEGLEYSISAEGYGPQRGSFTVQDRDVSINISLLKFSNIILDISDGAHPIEGALCKINNTTDSTDRNGIATFESISEADTVLYEVSAQAFETHSGLLIDFNADTTLQITLMEKNWELEFIISDRDGPCEGAQISINDDSRNTDSDGIACFYLKNGFYEYTITAEGYRTEMGSVTVDNSDVPIEYVLQAVGIEEILTDQIVISPNPTSGIVTVLFKEIEIPESVTIISQDGRVIKTIQDIQNQFEIDLSGQSKGIYYFVFKFPNQKNVKKVLLQ